MIIQTEGSKFLDQGYSSGNGKEGMNGKRHNKTFKCMLLFLKCDFFSCLYYNLPPYDSCKQSYILYVVLILRLHLHSKTLSGSKY